MFQYKGYNLPFEVARYDQMRQTVVISDGHWNMEIPMYEMERAKRDPGVMSRLIDMFMKGKENDIRKQFSQQKAINDIQGQQQIPTSSSANIHANQAQNGGEHKVKPDKETKKATNPVLLLLPV